MAYLNAIQMPCFPPNVDFKMAHLATNSGVAGDAFINCGRVGETFNSWYTIHSALCTWRFMPPAQEAKVHQGGAASRILRFNLPWVGADGLNAATTYTFEFVAALYDHEGGVPRAAMLYENRVPGSIARGCRVVVYQCRCISLWVSVRYDANGEFVTTFTDTLTDEVLHVDRRDETCTLQEVIDAALEVMPKLDVYHFYSSDHRGGAVPMSGVFKRRDLCRVCQMANAAGAAA